MLKLKNRKEKTNIETKTKTKTKGKSVFYGKCFDDNSVVNIMIIKTNLSQKNKKIN